MRIYSPLADRRGRGAIETGEAQRGQRIERSRQVGEGVDWPDVGQRRRRRRIIVQRGLENSVAAARHEFSRVAERLPGKSDSWRKIVQRLMPERENVGIALHHSRRY